MLVYQPSQAPLHLSEQKERSGKGGKFQAEIRCSNDPRDLAILRLDEDEARIDDHRDAGQEVIV